MKSRILIFALPLLCILLSACSASFTTESETLPCYYIADGQLYRIEDGTGILIPWSDESSMTRTATASICWNEDVLCAALPMENGTYGLFAYDVTGSVWSRLDEAAISYANDLNLADDEVYYMTGTHAQVARISVADGTQETLPIYRVFPSLREAFCVSNGNVYTLDYEIRDTETDAVTGEGLQLCRLEADGQSVTSFVLQDLEDSCYLLTEDWLYLVTPKIGYSRTEGQTIQIMRTSLPAGDIFEPVWEELPVPDGITAGDYGNWSYLCLEISGERVFYETPDGSLYLYENGESRFLWTLPEGQDSASYEPDYYFGGEYFAVVYSRAQQDIVYIGQFRSDN